MALSQLVHVHLMQLVRAMELHVRVVVIAGLSAAHSRNAYPMRGGSLLPSRASCYYMFECPHRSIFVVDTVELHLL